MESSNSSQQIAQKIIIILYPLLASPQDSTTRSIIAALRSLSAPDSVLANSLYIFSKLLPTDASTGMRLTPQQTAFRNMVANLLHSNIISYLPLFECFDADGLSLYVDTSVNHKNEEKRLRTRLWFTQTRFNLFREESEGYAKVISLLWEGMSPNPPPVESLIDDLISLIGQFNLDSNRVIELVLSAASDVVSELIAQSHVIPNDTRLPRLFCLLLDEFAPDHVYNVVGAMFQSYHPMHQSTSSSVSPDLLISDSDKKASRQFLGLVAVLIREGRMTVSDIWHHLSPRDNREVFKLFLHFENELVELSKTICSASSHLPHDQLLDPAKLPYLGHGASDRDLLTQYRFISQGPFSNVQYQKLQLISQLIGMCRWRDAMSAILHLSVNNEHVDVAADQQIAVPISKFVEFLLSPVMNSIFPSFYPHHSPITDAIDRLGGRANGYPSPVRTIDQFLSYDPNAPGMYVREMLFTLGPYACVSTRLQYALCRLLKGQKDGEAFNIMRDVVLPAASLTQSNAGLANMIWSVLKGWSHTRRWKMYEHLRNKVYNTCAVYQIIAERASYEMRYILKRLTSETQRIHTYRLAKITHGQALAAFSATLDRVQGYPADSVTITPVIEACRNCTSLALDMLIFLVLDRMADSSRSRLKEDGINVAQWYSTLSLFLGLCLRKLPLSPQHMEGVIGFLYSKLAKQPEALLITALSDIIKCVADVEVDVNLTAKQITAQAGGVCLQKMVGGVWGRLAPETSVVGSSLDLGVEREKRFAVLNLQEAFAKSGVHVWIGISIAQLTRTAVFDEDLKAMPLKLSANIVDRARSSLMQLSQFLDLVPPAGSLSEKVHKDLWDSLKRRGLTELITVMNVPTSSAVILLSPILDFLGISEPNGWRHGQGKNASLTSEFDDETLPSDQLVYFEGISKEKRTQKAELDAFATVSTPDLTENINLKTADRSNNSTENTNPSALMKPVHFSFVISNRTKGRLAPMLVNAFWTLKFSDVCVPESLYDSELKRMHSIKSLWEKEYERFRRHTHGETERPRHLESELRILRENIDDLEKEKDLMVKRHKAVVEKLKRLKKELCCPYASGRKEDRVENAFYFVQECVLPRSRVSAPDALFCAKFVLLFLDLDIPAIATTEFFEILLNLIPIILRSCSENEALSFSRLIKEILHSLEKWRSNKKIFETEVQSGLGGLRQISRDGENKPFRHEQYCQWLFDIHNRLTVGLCAVVTHREYLYSRNCLSILAGVAEVFPKVSEHSAKLEECIAKLTQSDLEDIRLSSSGVLARLRSGKAKRVPEFMFRLRPHSSHSSTANENVRAVESNALQNSAAKPAAGNSVPDDGSRPAQESEFIKSHSERIEAPIEVHMSPTRGTPCWDASMEAQNTRLSGSQNGPAVEEEGNDIPEKAKLNTTIKLEADGITQSSIQSARPSLGKRPRIDSSNMQSSQISEVVPNTKRTKLPNGDQHVGAETIGADILPTLRSPETCKLPRQADENINTTNNMKDASFFINRGKNISFQRKEPRNSGNVLVKVTEPFTGENDPNEHRQTEIQTSGESHGGTVCAADKKQTNHIDDAGRHESDPIDCTSSVVRARPSKKNLATSGENKSDIGKNDITNAMETSHKSGGAIYSNNTKDMPYVRGHGYVSSKIPENGTFSRQSSRGNGLTEQEGSRKTKNEFSNVSRGELRHHPEIISGSGGLRRKTKPGGISGLREEEKVLIEVTKGAQVSRIENNPRSSFEGRDEPNFRENGEEHGLIGLKRPFDDTHASRVSGGNGIGTDSGKREINSNLGNRDMNGRGEAIGSRNRRSGETFDVHGSGIPSGLGGTLSDGGFVKDNYGDNANNPSKRRREIDTRRRGRMDGNAEYDRRRDVLDVAGSHVGSRYASGNGISPRVGGAGGIGDMSGNLSTHGHIPIGEYGDGQGVVGWSGPREDVSRRRSETDNVGWQSRSRESYDMGRNSTVTGSTVGADRYRERRDERRDHRDTGSEREIRGDPGRDRDHRERIDRRRHSGGGNRRRRSAR